MIQANELRLDNLILYNNGTDKVGKVTTIWNDVVFLDDKNLKTSCPLALCNPIPLTEEILVKLGFEKDDTGVDMYDQDYYEWYQKEFPIIGVLCQNDIKEYLFDENTDTLRVRFVHQLQNLIFALTGQELEIQL